MILTRKMNVCPLMTSVYKCAAHLYLLLQYKCLAAFTISTSFVSVLIPTL